MRYFEHIIDRTLGSAPYPVRPAVTPDSIPESLAMEAKSAPASDGHKVAQPGKQAKDPAEPAMAGNSRRGNLHKGDAARKVSGAPPRQERPPDTVQDFPVVPGIKESQPSGPEIQKALAPPAAKDVFAVNTAESEPATERVGKVLEPAPERLPAEKAVTGMQEPDARATDEEPVKQTFSQPVESPADKKEKTYALLPEPEPELEPSRLSAPQENYAHDAGTKTASGTQPENPSIVPAASGIWKYPTHALQPEETVVTINIGRIEVRAEQPAEPARVPRRRFSPSLSLTDYLKHRSEGKAA